MILPPAPSDFRTLQRILLVLLVAIASIVLVTLLWNVGERFSQAVLVVFVGWVLAIVISPVVQSMNRRFRIPMALGVVLLYVVGLLIGGGVAVILIPLLVNQLEQLAAAIPRLEQDLLNAVGVVSVPLENLGISLTDALDFQSIARQGGQLLLTTSGALLGLLGNLLGGLFNLVLILTIAFYSVLDQGRMVRGALRILPADARPYASIILRSAQEKFGGFVRGTVVQAFLYAITTFLVMTILDIPFSVPVSIWAFFAMLIPYLGPFLVTFALYIAAATMGDWLRFGVLVIVDQIQSQLVLNVIGPRLFGKTVGLPPVVVLAALLIGLAAAGVWGAIFAIPIAGVIAAILDAVVEIRDSEKTAEEVAQERRREAQEAVAVPGDDPPDGVPVEVQAEIPDAASARASAGGGEGSV